MIRIRNKQYLNTLCTSHFINLSSLLIAAKRGRTEIVQLLLSKGANVNDKNYKGETAMMEAAKKNRIELIEVLISNGGDVNAKNNRGISSIMMAFHKGAFKACKLLLFHGANASDADR